ncbi:MAG: hypothetical protein IPN40_12335 [Uliginosibacterium sp.]|nr:hypothetical protein [Uliginosibacterium sp.]
MKTSKTEHWSAKLARVGNQAVRNAQARNRELGIANRYSLNGRLVGAVSVTTVKAGAKTKLR